MKRLMVLASMAAMLVAVAACSTTGQPEPVTTSSAAAPTTTSDPGSGSTSQAATGGDVANMNACSLLTASEATSVGLPSAGYTENNGGKSGCEWDGSAAIVSVVIRTDVGLAGVLANGGTVTSTQIGSHQAKELQDAGGCTYILGITDSSRVDVGATALSGGAVCPESLAVAQLVEKRLS